MAQKKPVPVAANADRDLLKPVRVTADLPKREFALLKAARKLHDASTTDIARALIRLHADDPELSRRVTAEILKMKIERLAEKSRDMAERLQEHTDEKEGAAA
ncbi:hypothetical protein [Streptantibioticus ferralitis]|uniref:Uncharacterized protein n=1 Tax=Streptantibioticus ferralitis TaxID=236510 RepID=A0ABT5ZAR4_9ACTN|nr:hypothetical protein [Streptantibioticus ferralitis]MDF2260914.1 hypothetical protein [Streptantibioticus ferralitis]